jgi:N-acyl-D-aspartate/D-glutamate deacylase
MTAGPSPSAEVGSMHTFRRSTMRFLHRLLPLLVVIHTTCSRTTSPAYDVVLHRGRVMDPESGLDADRDVGITGRKISAISTRPLHGRVEVDAKGLVVAPGFIDLHQHGQSPEHDRYKAMDGVTTALELEVGAFPLDEWYAARSNKALINFGASAGPIPARMKAMRDTGTFAPRDAALNRVATLDEQKAIAAAVQKSLEEGALGVGLHLEFAPTLTREEVLGMFYLAARWKRPVFVHVRKPGTEVIESLQEVIADAAAAGAPLHVMHIAGTAGRRTPEALHLIESVRAHGMDVTAEVYPYVAGAGLIESGMFNPGFQEARGITYTDLMWPPTGERLTQQTFERYRKQGGPVVMFLNTEEMVRSAIAHPLVMIASDGGFNYGQGHPRGFGTFARIVGKYVREDKAISLMEAIGKCSLMPAQRLEAMSPQMRAKGRIRVGADADISVFDAEHVIDKATFENAMQYSEGFRYVLVEGSFVVRDGRLLAGVAPGQAIRAR